MVIQPTQHRSRAHGRYTPDPVSKVRRVLGSDPAAALSRGADPGLSSCPTLHRDRSQGACAQQWPMPKTISALTRLA